MRTATMISRALFMIFLILSLPVIHAASISQTYVTTDSGLRDYVKPGSPFTYTAVIVTDPSDDVTNLASKVFRGNTRFTACTVSQLISNQYLCTLTQTLSATAFENVLTYDVTLVGPDPLVPSQTVQGSFFVDSSAPKITITSAGQVGNNISVSFSVLEELSNGYSQHCTNVSYVEFLIDGQIIQTKQLQNSGCTFTESFSAAVSGTGQKQVCLKARDGVGNIGTTCRAVSMDLTKPAISNVQFVSGTTPLAFISPVGGLAQLRFTVDKVLSSASATINGNAVTLTCTTTCTSSSVPISVGAQAIVITVRDLLGNEQVATQTLTVTADTTAPVVEGISAAVTSGNTVYAKEGSILNVTIFDTQSGVAKETIFANGMRADDCISANSKWYCSFNSLDFSGDGNVSISITGSDRVGNTLNPRSFNITRDNTPPIVSNLRVGAVGTLGGTNLVASGGRVVVNATVLDASPITFVGNFSLLEGGFVAGSCNRENCTVTSQAVGTGPLSVPAYITVSDIVGNNVTVETGIIELLQTATGVTNYFNHRVELRPAKIELSTAKYVNQRGFAQITILPKPDAQVLSATFGSCYNVNRTAATGDLRLFQRINQTQSGNADVVSLNLLLRAMELNQSRISVVCDVTVTGRYSTYYIPGEVEQVLITFETFNLSVGTLDESYQKLLAERTKIAKNHIGAKLESFEKLFDIAAKICRLFRVVMIGISLVQVGSSAFGRAEEATLASGFLAWLTPAFWAKKAGLCFLATGMEFTATNFISNAANAVCQFVNCEWSIAKTGSALANSGNNAQYNAIANRPSGGGLLGANTLGGAINFIDPHDSLAGAVLNLCIPGIIKNLRKAQQIECQYAVCLRDEVPNGIPVSACTEAYDYNKCVYTKSNLMVLAIIPAIINFWVNQFKAIVADPFAVAGVVWVAGACGITCPAPGAIIKDGCVIAKMAQALGGLVKNILAIKDDWRSGNDYEANDYCSML